MSTKRFSSNLNTGNTRVQNQKGENWLDSTNGDMASSPTKQQGARKQMKYNKSKSGKFSPVSNKNSSFNNSKLSEDLLDHEQRGCDSNEAGYGETHSDFSSESIVPVDKTQKRESKSSYVPSLSVEHSINDSLSQSDDSVIYNPSQDQATNDSSELTTNDQTNYSCSQMFAQEISCNTSGVYTTANDYDYSNGTVPNNSVVPQVLPPQQGSPYLYYQPHYSDYTALAVNPALTPQQQTGVLNNSNNYYGYQAYVYDPNLGAYTLNTYSPMQTQQPPVQQAQMAPQHQAAVMSSPQHQSTMLASYHTPPQPQHQLYISPSNMNTPSCLSPSDTATPNSTGTTTNSSSTNDQMLSNTNSPQQTIPSQTTPGYYPPNQYLVYPTQNPYLTPQGYQSPIVPGQAYMMYQPQQMAQCQTPVSMQGPQTPTSYNNKYNRSNRYNNNKYKRNNQRYNNSNNNNGQVNNSVNTTTTNMSTAESTPQFPSYAQAQNMYLSNSASPITSNQAEGAASSEDVEACTDPTMCTPGMCSPSSNTYDYYDQNHMMALQQYYEYANSGITTYGEEFDEEENSAEEENEQLACYVCRGRRMCFCYFLKVRYYKFPSFLDLVDHQYKKWRSNMVKAKKSTA